MERWFAAAVLPQADGANRLLNASGNGITCFLDIFSHTCDGATTGAKSHCSETKES